MGQTVGHTTQIVKQQRCKPTGKLVQDIEIVTGGDTWSRFRYNKR